MDSCKEMADGRERGERLSRFKSRRDTARSDPGSTGTDHCKQRIRCVAQKPCLLRFVVEESLAGRADRIKAYTIATSVLGRDEAFDPQSDPIVRSKPAGSGEASSAII